MIVTSESSLPDLSGQNVRQYFLAALLGSGASGKVYRAVDTSSQHQRTYAIKCMPKVNVSPYQNLQQILEITINMVVSGTSPYIVTLRNVIEEEHYSWVVLDLCESDLHKAIWHNKVFVGNNRRIRRAFLEIIDGVSACHRQGVYHRDLKPGNILCKADGTGIRIADFGLSTSERICRGEICGTCPYMSPEYWIGETNITFPLLTDVWALGIILLNMVTSSCPWESAHPSDPGFRAFLDDEDHLLKTYPISEQLNILLKWILHPRASKRISLPQIRLEIVQMKSFYKSPPPKPAAWSREVAFKPVDSLFGPSNSKDRPHWQGPVDGNNMEPQADHAIPEVPLAKIRHPDPQVREKKKRVLERQEEAEVPVPVPKRRRLR